MENTASGSVTREANGDISLTFRASPHGVVKYTAPPNIWASHFCDASQGGEAYLRWYTAMTFLKSSGPIDVVAVPLGQEGLHGHGSGEPPKLRSGGRAIQRGDIVAHRSPGSSPYVSIGRIMEMSGDGFGSLFTLFRVWGPGIPWQSTRVVKVDGDEDGTRRVPLNECVFLVESGETR